MKENKKTIWEYGFLAVAGMLVVLFVLLIFTGDTIKYVKEFNAYALQADRWRQGYLDLGQDYSWLELAIFDGKYYCSFPPFPSYVLLPLTLIFGSETPDGAVMLLFAVLSMIFLYRIGLKTGLGSRNACMGALLFTMCSNYMFLFFNPMVWFMAQGMCFSLSVMAIYGAMTGRGMWALFLWACSVGCRPQQIVFLPVILLLLSMGHKESDPEESLFRWIRRKWYWALPCLFIAGSYMALNYARFGSIIEFGHNYLPEFVNIHKQFSPEYIPSNFESLMHLPRFEGKRIVIDIFGNCNIFLVDPGIIFSVIALIAAIVKKHKKETVLSAVVFVCCTAQVLFTLMHATMGAWHFGNRYFVDCLPWLFLPYAAVTAKEEWLAKWQLPFGIWGLCFNLLGSLFVYYNP